MSGSKRICPKGEFKRGVGVGLVLVLLTACLVAADVVVTAGPASANGCAEDPYGPAPDSDWPEPGEETQVYAAGDVTVSLTWQKVGDGSLGNPYEWGKISWTTPVAVAGNLDWDPWVTIEYLSNVDGQWYPAGSGAFNQAGEAFTPGMRGVRVCDIDVGHLRFRNVNEGPAHTKTFQVNQDGRYWHDAYIPVGEEWAFFPWLARAGSYTVFLATYTIPPEELADWLLIASCVSDLGSTHPLGAAFPLVDNETVTCSLVWQPAPATEELGRIVIRKVASPAGASEAFSFQPSWGAIFQLTGGADREFQVAAGVHSVTEVSLAPGWSLSDAVCDDGSSPAAIGVSPGETVTCTFTNAYATCLGRPATIVGGPGADTLVGTPGPDVIAGLGGGDTIYGLGGDDRICGGAGPDQIWAGSGRDRVRGGAGADTLWGGSGRDRLRGGIGSDAADGGGGIDGCWAETTAACE